MSILCRGSKGFFSGGEDPLSNVSAGTGLLARKPLPDITPKMKAIRGKQFSVRYSQRCLAYLVSVKMACKILRLSDVEGLAKTYLNAWKSGKVYCPHENYNPL